MRKVYLASGSVRRRILMKNIVPDFIPLKVDEEEKEYTSLSPEKKACARAMDKLKAALRIVDDKSAVIVCADTVVDLNGKTLGKPKDKKDAFLMMCALSGREHTVHTGVSVSKDGVIYSFCRHTRVKFRPLPLDFIKDYVNTPEPYDKAGGYGIQGRVGRYVIGIKGDYYNVVGFPMAKVKKLLSIMKIV